MISHFIDVPSGGKLHYIQTGNSAGPLIVCLHGLGGSTATYTPLVPSLPQSCNIILVDFPGFGQSPVGPSTPTIAGHVDDLHHLITSVQAACRGKEAEKLLLIGHSLGTAVAMHYASQHPASVAGLVLLAALRSAAHIPAVKARMLDMAANTRRNGISWAADLASKSNVPSDDRRHIHPDVRQAVFDAVAASDPEGYARTCEMMVDESHRDPAYEDITCPSVLVAGDLDVINPVERSPPLAKLFGSKDCWVEVVMSGHQMILEDLPGVEGAVGRLLERARFGGSS